MPEFDSRALFEKLILDGFQAGLSWITILRKRDAFRAAFANFDPEKIARFDAKEIAALMGQSAASSATAPRSRGLWLSARVWLEDPGAGRLFQTFYGSLLWTAAAERLSFEGANSDAVGKIGGVV